MADFYAFGNNTDLEHHVWTTWGGKVLAHLRQSKVGGKPNDEFVCGQHIPVSSLEWKNPDPDYPTQKCAACETIEMDLLGKQEKLKALKMKPAGKIKFGHKLAAEAEEVVEAEKKPEKYKLSLITNVGQSTTIKTAKEMEDELAQVGVLYTHNNKISHQKVIIVVEPYEEPVKFNEMKAEKETLETHLELLREGIQKVLDVSKVEVK